MLQHVNKAYLLQSISFMKEGVEITVPKHTIILVDTKEGIALIEDGSHVDIFQDEYSLIIH